MKNRRQSFRADALQKILQHDPDKEIQTFILDVRDSFITGEQSVQEINSNYSELGIKFSYAKDEGLILSTGEFTYRINGASVSVEKTL